MASKSTRHHRKESKKEIDDILKMFSNVCDKIDKELSYPVNQNDRQRLISAPQLSLQEEFLRDADDGNMGDLENSGDEIENKHRIKKCSKLTNHKVSFRSNSVPSRCANLSDSRNDISVLEVDKNFIVNGSVNLAECTQTNEIMDKDSSTFSDKNCANIKFSERKVHQTRISSKCDIDNTESSLSVANETNDLHVYDKCNKKNISHVSDKAKAANNFRILCEVNNSNSCAKDGTGSEIRASRGRVRSVSDSAVIDTRKYLINPDEIKNVQNSSANFSAAVPRRCHSSMAEKWSCQKQKYAETYGFNSNEASGGISKINIQRIDNFENSIKTEISELITDKKADSGEILKGKRKENCGRLRKTRNKTTIKTNSTDSADSASNEEINLLIENKFDLSAASDGIRRGYQRSKSAVQSQRFTTTHPETLYENVSTSNSSRGSREGMSSINKRACSVDSNPPRGRDGLEITQQENIEEEGYSDYCSYGQEITRQENIENVEALGNEDCGSIANKANKRNGVHIVPEAWNHVPVYRKSSRDEKLSDYEDIDNMVPGVRERKCGNSLGSDQSSKSASLIEGNAASDQTSSIEIENKISSPFQMQVDVGSCDSKESKEQAEKQSEILNNSAAKDSITTQNVESKSEKELHVTYQCTNFNSGDSCVEMPISNQGLNTNQNPALSKGCQISCTDNSLFSQEQKHLSSGDLEFVVPMPQFYANLESYRDDNYNRDQHVQVADGFYNSNSIESSQSSQTPQLPLRPVNMRSNSVDVPRMGVEARYACAKLAENKNSTTDSSIRSDENRTEDSLYYASADVLGQIPAKVRRTAQIMEENLTEYVENHRSEMARNQFQRRCISESPIRDSSNTPFKNQTSQIRTSNSQHVCETEQNFTHLEDSVYRPILHHIALSDQNHSGKQNGFGIPCLRSPGSETSNAKSKKRRSLIGRGINAFTSFLSGSKKTPKFKHQKSEGDAAAIRSAYEVPDEVAQINGSRHKRKLSAPPRYAPCYFKSESKDEHPEDGQDGFPDFKERYSTPADHFDRAVHNSLPVSSGGFVVFGGEAVLSEDAHLSLDSTVPAPQNKTTFDSLNGETFDSSRDLIFEPCSQGNTRHGDENGFVLHNEDHNVSASNFVKLSTPDCPSSKYPNSKIPTRKSSLKDYSNREGGDRKPKRKNSGKKVPLCRTYSVNNYTNTENVSGVIESGTSSTVRQLIRCQTPEFSLDEAEENTSLKSRYDNLSDDSLLYRSNERVKNKRGRLSEQKCTSGISNNHKDKHLVSEKENALVSNQNFTNNIIKNSTGNSSYKDCSQAPRQHIPVFRSVSEGVPSAASNFEMGSPVMGQAKRPARRLHSERPSRPSPPERRNFAADLIRTTIGFNNTQSTQFNAQSSVIISNHENTVVVNGCSTSNGPQNSAENHKNLEITSKDDRVNSVVLIQKTTKDITAVVRNGESNRTNRRVICDGNLQTQTVREIISRSISAPNPNSSFQSSRNLNFRNPNVENRYSSSSDECGNEFFGSGFVMNHSSQVMCNGSSTKLSTESRSRPSTIREIILEKFSSKDNVCKSDSFNFRRVSSKCDRSYENLPLASQQTFSELESTNQQEDVSEAVSDYLQRLSSSEWTTLGSLISTFLSCAQRNLDPEKLQQEVQQFSKGLSRYLLNGNDRSFNHFLKENYPQVSLDDTGVREGIRSALRHTITFNQHLSA